MADLQLSEYQLKEIARIDQAIKDYLEYLEKLHGKNSHVRSVNVKKLSKKQRAKFDKYNPKVNITRFSKKKLDELERQKELILKQREVSKSIVWDKVKFDDHHIRIAIDGYLSQPFALPESRKSFEFIKPYIQRTKLTPIRVRTFGNRIIAIENLDELLRIIEILSVQEEINLYFNDFTSTSIDKIFSKLENVSNQHFLELFKLKEKGSYMSYLCQVQSANHKIIPTTEIHSYNEKINFTEETFLFTTRRKKSLYVIWESTSINRATYIFKTNQDFYQAYIQKLFDFVASTQPRKRRQLRYSMKLGKNELHAVAVIEHDSVDLWVKHLQAALKA